MPTAVVDRPHSPVTDSRTRPVALAPRRAHTASPTRPVPTEARSTGVCFRPEALPGSRPGVRAGSSAPARTRRQHSALAAEATEVCASCPLLTACLYRAVVEYDVAGFVAGTTERQRAQIRARLGVEVEPEDFDTSPVWSAASGRSTTTRSYDCDERIRTRAWSGSRDGSGCSLSTVKRHLRKERNQPSPAIGTRRPRPTEAQVRRAAGETLAENSGNRRAAA